MTVFEASRAIGVIDAAQRLGLPMRRSGQRYVTRCPRHPDRTPSLTLYPDGRGYCFSCQWRADAVGLYQHARGITPLEAARAVCADFGLAADGKPAPAPQPKRPTAQDLHRALESWREEKVQALLNTRRAAAVAMSQREEALSYLPPDRIWDDPEWARAMNQATRAQDEILRLDSLSPTDILQEMKEEKHGNL